MFCRLRAILLIWAYSISTSEADSQQCGEHAFGVQIHIEVEISVAVSGELRRAIANELLGVGTVGHGVSPKGNVSGSGIAAYNQTIRGNEFGNEAGFAESGWNWGNDSVAHAASSDAGDDTSYFSTVGSSLRFQSLGKVLHIEASTCNVTVQPAAVYVLALTAQRILGGGALRWSLAASPLPDNEDLRAYIGMMGSLFDEKELVASLASDFSLAEVWRINGASMLLLNNVIMSDTRDERRYHEMLVHPALLAAASPQKVLIIGGGEGATLREVLLHERVERALMVDIDEGLVNLCQEHLPMMHQGSFASPRTTVVFEDGIRHIESVAPGTYDAIIVDGIDVSEGYDDDVCISLETCTAYGDALFAKDFYMHAHRALRAGGVFAQYISWVDGQEYGERITEAGFNEYVIYDVRIDSFFGTGARFALAARDPGEQLGARVARRLLEGERVLEHLNASAFSESLASGGKKRRLKGGGHGDGANSSRPGLLGLISVALLWLRNGEELEAPEKDTEKEGKTNIREVAKVQPSNNATPEIHKLQSGRKVQLATPEEAVRAIDNDFGSWGPAAIAMYAGHLFWLLKEIFWLVMIPYPGFVAAGISAILFMYSLVLRIKGGNVAQFYNEAPVEVLINLIQLLWQVFNIVWMFAEFFFDEPDKVPAYAEDFVDLGDCGETGDRCTRQLHTCMMIFRIGFCATFCIWALFSVLLLYEWLTPPNLLSQGYAAQTFILQGGWVAFWVMKDFAWSFPGAGGACALAAWAVHFLLLVSWLATVSSRIVIVDGVSVENAQKFVDELGVVFDRINLSYVLWSLASLCWLLSDAFLEESLVVRFVAAGLCCLSFILYLSAYRHVKAKAHANDYFIRQLRKASVGDAQGSANSGNSGNARVVAVGPHDGGDVQAELPGVAPDVPSS